MRDKIIVAVDVMGSDNAPAIEVAAAVQAARNWGFSIILVGDQTRIAAELLTHDHHGLSLEVQHASEVVGMDDSASDAVRKKKDSSIRVAFDLVKAGRAHAVVSAGNSGATMAAGMFVLKRLPGIDRPAIATVMPTTKDHVLVLDAGGNVDCKSLHLVQFALMGEVYVQQILGKSKPVVGLLSNGAEESKGTELTREAHQLLKNCCAGYRGYIEGRDVFNGQVDVVVCDGFVGNIVLKVAEGLAEAIKVMLTREIKSRFWAKMGYLLMQPAFKAFAKKIDYAEYGGAPLLGIGGTGMICHGGSNERAVTNAIRMAHDFTAQRVNEKLLAHLREAYDSSAEVVDIVAKQPLAE